MTTSASNSHKRSLTALGAGAAVLIALTGCLPGSAAPQAAPESSAAQSGRSTASASATSKARGGDEATTPAAHQSSAAPAAPAAAGKLTAPGTALKFGQVANTHSNTGERDTPKYKEATHETSVTKIVAGNEADLAKLEDAAKFAGQVPYYVYTDIKLSSLSGPSAGMGDPRINAQLKDGTDAQKLIVFGTMGDCKSGNFETTGKDDAFTFVVGSTKTMCTVFLAPKGDAVTTASYDDSNYNYVKYGDNPYRDNPISWGN
ncbi:hypothetical protein MB46_03775 [Arthrobacter alpinus]|uniref:hypothetical protein n=1 Tax=Arthrobacter alpinus TaxID=656366 RepID=UPI00073A5B80|nr:hypothetical protein [Arthrobacter alpinus]ALV44763.1 hypothetical protein MB46_03775 [Arthrobacter alpinus]